MAWTRRPRTNLTEPTARPDAIVARLARLHPKLIDLSLGRIERLLAALDHPERRLPPVVHIAGTNGKGSVIAFLGAMLEAAGARVHAYTSPHLVRFNERIRLAGSLIDDAALIDVLEETETVNGEAPITVFEITTAAAFLAFSRVPADILLMETGLGGRLDATNVVGRPQLTAMTPVSLDHQEFLGHSLAEIAAEKAGILKPGVAVVLAEQIPEALVPIAERALALGAPTYRQGTGWTATPSGDGFAYSGAARRLELPLPGLVGRHQIENAALAIACLDRLQGFSVSERHIRDGLAAVDWPGRLQPLSRGPLPETLPRGWELWVDGGHNPGAGRILAVQARAWRDRPLYLIFGMMRTKDPVGFLVPLAPYLAGLEAVAVPGQEASFGAAEAAAAARRAGLEAAPADDLGAALASIRARAAAPARVLICGSLYLAGEVLSQNG